MRQAAFLIEIPYRELTDDALRGVVESVILREGTDYGAREYSHEEKVAQLMARIRRGEAHIVFDEETATVDIIGTDDNPERGGRTGRPA